MKRSDRLVDQPYLILRIDGIGALVTALSLLFFLPNCDWFSMPTDILYFLGSIAVIFAAYSLIHSFAQLPYTNNSIRIIVVGNLVYILTTWIFVSSLANELSNFAILYFIIEMSIILILVSIEWKITSIY